MPYPSNTSMAVIDDRPIPQCRSAVSGAQHTATGRTGGSQMPTLTHLTQ